MREDLLAFLGLNGRSSLAEELTGQGYHCNKSVKIDYQTCDARQFWWTPRGSFEWAE
jgi:hypothetical protein